MKNEQTTNRKNVKRNPNKPRPPRHRKTKHSKHHDLDEKKRLRTMQIKARTISIIPPTTR
jgi:hypothetical protein